MKPHFIIALPFAFLGSLPSVAKAKHTFTIRAMQQCDIILRRSNASGSQLAHALEERANSRQGVQDQYFEGLWRGVGIMPGFNIFI